MKTSRRTSSLPTGLALAAMLATAVSVSPRLRAQSAPAAQTTAQVASGFATPPEDAKALMRWWWFGPAVTKPELEREILAMKAGGFGGFEIQPVYPVALDDPNTGFKNLPYMSPEFLSDVHYVADLAAKNHMRVGLTLASGWPYGGPNVPITEAASRLRVVATDLPSNADSVALPSIGNGELLIEAFVGDGSANEYDATKLTLLPVHAANGRTPLTAAPSARVVVFYIASRSGQQVKRAAVNAEGFVLDHLSRAAVEDHLHTIADPLIQAFGATPPYSVFSDSLEVYSTDWTDDFAAQFKRRRGYDLLPWLPVLVTGQGPDAAGVRRDWGKTITDLVDENYLTPINDWAKAHHTLFRSQTYGEPAVSMSSNRLVALPEGEGPQWRSFSFTRWATSASHLYGRPVTSAETWTWLHSPAFRATPLDMKAEADRMFLEGVNQFVGHGWPYTPQGVAEPGWSFYAAAVFNDHNPWWPVMPDVASYFQRMSYLLRQGKPANDIAVLLPDDDAYAAFTLGKASLSAAMKNYVTPTLTEQILDSGYNLDYIDEEAIDQVGIPYPVLVLPHVTRMSPELLGKIAAYQKKGGKVIVVGAPPSLAPGHRDAAKITAQVKSMAQSTFAPGSIVSDDDQLGPALRAALPPDMQVAAHTDEVGFIHRKLPDADIYFFVNSSAETVHTTATFRNKRPYAAWWDPFTSKIAAADPKAELNLAPYESRVLVFTDTQQATGTPHSPELITSNATQIADLSHDWHVSFTGEPAETMATLHSWTDDEHTRYYSGVGVYTREIDLTAAQLNGKRILLDFGPGSPTTDTRKVASGMRAMLDSPIREAAIVMVNGVRAGSVWHPPYALDITAQLHAGHNHLEIRVGNLGINTLAGRPPTDYRLLDSKYGKRFDPQDMNNLQPLPSGILGPVKLMGESQP